jgi:hypothetical protein
VTEACGPKHSLTLSQEDTNADPEYCISPTRVSGGGFTLPTFNDTFSYRGAGTAVISMVCSNEGAVLIPIKLFDRTDLKKAEYVRLTAGNKGSGCHTGVTVEGKVENVGHGGRLTVTDGLPPAGADRHGSDGDCRAGPVTVVDGAAR